MTEKIASNYLLKNQSFPSFGTSGNERYVQPMPAGYGADEFLIESAKANKKIRKKENNKDKWYKTGVCANVVLAAAFAAIAVTTVLPLFKGGKKASKLVFEDIGKNTDFPNLTDECVNPKVRKFIETIKKQSGVKQAVSDYTGSTVSDQCLLMYGPSGTGKTFSAKMLAKEIGAQYSEVQFADVSSPYIGQTSVEIKAVFDALAKRAKKEPDKKFLLAFNEIDALLVPREKCGANNLHLAENRTAFLNGLDLVKNFHNVKIVGTTNVHPESGNLDKASLSRFANMLEIPLPTQEELLSSLKFHLRNCKAVEQHKFFDKNASEIKKLVKELHDRKYSQRDVEDIATKAKNQFGIKVNESKNLAEEKFDIKYLKDAVEDKGLTTGAIESEPIPRWQTIPQPVKKDLLTKFKTLFRND